MLKKRWGFFLRKTASLKGEFFGAFKGGESARDAATVLVPGLKVTLISSEVVFSSSVLLPQGSVFQSFPLKSTLGS